MNERPIRTELAEFGDVSLGTHKILCRICANTHLGRAQDINLARSVGWIANMLLDEIRELKDDAQKELVEISEITRSLKTTPTEGGKKCQA